MTARRPRTATIRPDARPRELEDYVPGSSSPYPRRSLRWREAPARQTWYRNANHAMAPATTTTGIRITANHSANDATISATATTAITAAHANIRAAIGGRRGR